MDIFNMNKDKAMPTNICGVDLGYGFIKISSGDSDIQFQSIVGEPISDFSKNAAVTSMNELLDSLAVTYEGKKYYVGHNAAVNTRNGRISLRQNKTDDIQNKIKLITALALLTIENQKEAVFDIVTGLPVLEYKNQKDKLYDMLRNNNNSFEFIMHYGNNDVEKKIRLRHIKVISQGEGAFYAYVLDNAGNIIQDKIDKVSGTVMIVDTGYKTTDVVTMENGRYLEPLSDQLNKGVSQMHQEVLRLIMERLNIKKELKDIDDIVRSKKLFHNRKEYDITTIISDAAKPFAEDIVENLYTVSNGDLGSMQNVLLTGGGAEIIYPFVQQLLYETVGVDKLYNAEFSNARGYYRYGMLLQNQGMLEQYA